MDGTIVQKRSIDHREESFPRYFIHTLNPVGWLQSIVFRFQTSGFNTGSFCKYIYTLEGGIKEVQYFKNKHLTISVKLIC